MPSGAQRSRGIWARRRQPAVLRQIPPLRPAFGSPPVGMTNPDAGPQNPPANVNRTPCHPTSQVASRVAALERSHENKGLDTYTICRTWGVL